MLVPKLASTEPEVSLIKGRTVNVYRCISTCFLWETVFLFHQLTQRAIWKFDRPNQCVVSQIWQPFARITASGHCHHVIKSLSIRSFLRGLTITTPSTGATTTSAETNVVDWVLIAQHWTPELPWQQGYHSNSLVVSCWSTSTVLLEDLDFCLDIILEHFQWRLNTCAQAHALPAQCSQSQQPDWGTNPHISFLCSGVCQSLSVESIRISLNSASTPWIPGILFQCLSLAMLQLALITEHLPSTYTLQFHLQYSDVFQGHFAFLYETVAVGFHPTMTTNLFCVVLDVSKNFHETPGSSTHWKYVSPPPNFAPTALSRVTTSFVVHLFRKILGRKRQSVIQVNNATQFSSCSCIIPKRHE